MASIIRINDSSFYDIAALKVGGGSKLMGGAISAINAFLQITTTTFWNCTTDANGGARMLFILFYFFF
jgi:hypothetical protein